MKKTFTAKDRDRYQPNFVNDLDPDYMMDHYADNNE